MTTPPKLLGKYRTPKFRLGDVVRCARRGEVRIVGLSDAPIPWPIGQSYRRVTRSLLTYAGLTEVSARARLSRASALCRLARRTGRRLGDCPSSGRRPSGRRLYQVADAVVLYGGAVGLGEGRISGPLGAAQRHTQSPADDWIRSETPPDWTVVASSLYCPLGPTPLPMRVIRCDCVPGDCQAVRMLCRAT
jgi:hypothetical protein